MTVGHRCEYERGTTVKSNESLQSWIHGVGLMEALAALAEFAEPGAVFAVDAEGRIRFWSRGAEHLIGIAAAGAVGRPATELVVCHECDGLAVLMERGCVRDEPAELRRPNGARLRVSRSGRAFHSPEGNFAGAVILLRAEPVVEPAAGAEIETFHGLVTRDAAMKNALKILRNVAETEVTVLIRGESGTGKELVSRALHEESPRQNGPFLAINCATLTPNLLESELFGHVRGAFTGAMKDHAGLFKRADGGTLFLDEVAELPLELQAKLLRVLQDKTFLPVGGDRPVRVDVRIVAATHRSLREEVKAGRFREDLMYRLRVVPIFLPPLRERRGDIALLLDHFIERNNRRGPRRIQRMAPETLRTLMDYHWPGNVRELQNVVEYAFAVGRGEVWQVENLPPEFSEPHEDGEPPIAKSGLRTPDERERIRVALETSGGHIDRAAALAGMSRATFWRKRRKYGM